MAFGVIGIRREALRVPREQFDSSLSKLLDIHEMADDADVLEKIRLLTDALESGVVASNVQVSHPLLAAVLSLWSTKNDDGIAWKEYVKRLERLQPSYRALAIARVPRLFLHRAIALGDEYTSSFDGEASESLRETLDGLRTSVTKSGPSGD